MKRAKELQDQTDEQLESLIVDLRCELFELKNELAMTHKLDKSHLIREKKRQMARTLGILTERKKVSHESK
jgi:ribosomal protein L29